MDDKKILQDEIAGLKSKIVDLRKNERAFLKVAGIEEQIEKTKLDLAEREKDIETEKYEIQGLQLKKSDAIAKTMQSLADTMSEVLPYGRAVFHVDNDGNFNIGWHFKAANICPYYGLSGSEKAQFDVALGYAMLKRFENRLLVLEGSEIDEESLFIFLQHLEAQNPGAQIIVNHWLEAKQIPPNWNKITLHDK